MRHIVTLILLVNAYVAAADDRPNILWLTCEDNNVNWEQLKNQQPFFMVINNTQSHESRAFGDVNNLIDDPTYAKEVARLSKALDEWQLRYFDSGLLPESEIVKRSEESGKTIYEFVRTPSLYDLPALQRAASRALEQDPSNLQKFYDDLNSTDSGIRYWAVVGCFNLQESVALNMEVIRELLDDEEAAKRTRRPPLRAPWTV